MNPSAKHGRLLVKQGRLAEARELEGRSVFDFRQKRAIVSSSVAVSSPVPHSALGHRDRAADLFFQPLAAQQAVEKRVLDFAVHVPALAKKTFTLKTQSLEGAD
jgi:hypothetical protein